MEGRCNAQSLHRPSPSHSFVSIGSALKVSQKIRHGQRTEATIYREDKENILMLVLLVKANSPTASATTAKGFGRVLPIGFR
jgi:hypothetical protein